MTPSQRIALQADWWPAACRVQGWKTGDRELRLQVLSLAVTFTFTSVQEFREALDQYETHRHMPAAEHRPKFRHLASASELNATNDIDAVNTTLLLLADNLKAAEEIDRPSRGVSRRHRDVIEDHIRCLSQYPLEQPMGRAGAVAFVEQLIADKFNRHRASERMSLDDVDDRPRFVPHIVTGQLEEKPSQMTQLLWTVNARLNGKTGYRAKAGHSLHDMLTGVGLPCGCKRCVSGGNVRHFVAALAGVAEVPEPVENPF